MAMPRQPSQRVRSQEMPAAEGSGEMPPQPARTVIPFTPLVELQHLLKVAGSISQDANGVWAELWGELKRCVGHNGAVVPEAEKGFVPSCGWPEFLEKFWQLKMYVDSIRRVCGEKS